MFCSLPRSSFETLAGGMRAILATISSTSALLMVFLRLLSGTSIWAAPTSYSALPGMPPVSRTMTSNAKSYVSPETWVATMGFGTT